jgi:hypothetical protein
MTDVFLDPAHLRVLCECCRYPTLIPPLTKSVTPYYPGMPRDCPLCEWENGELDLHGEPVATDPDNGAERNGGHSLAEAQVNFAKFLSMYDPAQPEPWMPEPPTREELRWKESLVRQYKSILDPFFMDRATALGEILTLESALSQAARGRAEAADVPIDPSAEPAAGMSDTEWMLSQTVDDAIDILAPELHNETASAEEEGADTPPPTQSNDEGRSSEQRG